MNLHQIVAGSVAAVNPLITLSLSLSIGSTTNADFSRTPIYAAPVTASGQVQPLTAADLRQMEGINLNGTERRIYVNGALAGTVRPTLQGGDLITLPGGSTYLVTLVLEQWPDWCAVAATQQHNN